MTETDEVVVHAWAARGVWCKRSLDRAHYPGWDSHPGELANRYRATDAFYRSVLSAAATRLTNSRTRQASGVMDEPAAGRALAHRKRRVDQR